MSQVKGVAALLRSLSWMSTKRQRPTELHPRQPADRSMGSRQLGLETMAQEWNYFAQDSRLRGIAMSYACSSSPLAQLRAWLCRSTFQDHTMVSPLCHPCCQNMYHARTLRSLKAKLLASFSPWIALTLTAARNDGFANFQGQSSKGLVGLAL